MSTTTTKITISLLLIPIFLLTGCASMYDEETQDYYDYMYSGDMQIVQARGMLFNLYVNSPDTDVWYNERQQLSKAIGDRDFDINFSRTFDSVVIAMSSLELPVMNMERQSGYMIAQGAPMSPTETDVYRVETVKQWARMNGQDSSSLDKPLRSKQGKMQVKSMEMMFNSIEFQRSVTFQLVKLNKDRTRIKARIKNVYYPEELNLCYERIWQAIDKQLFIDKNIDGEKVDKRT